MDPLSHCPTCRASVRRWQQYCHACGAWLPSPTEAPPAPSPGGYHCPQCGLVIGPGQPVCGLCGQHLDPASLAAAQQAREISTPRLPPAARRRPSIASSLILTVILIPILALFALALVAVLSPHTGATMYVSTPVPVPAAVSPALPAYASGGLDLTQADWDAQHGAPNQGAPSAGLANYEQNKYIVAFWGGAVMTINRQAGNGNTMPLTRSEAEAHAMLPTDATLVETHTELPTGGGAVDTVEQWVSPSLIARYASQGKVGDFPWWDGGPGSIGIICYGNLDGWIMSAGYAKQ